MDGWLEYLTSARLDSPGGAQTIRTVDLFSGIGGLALGFGRAAGELGKRFVSAGAIDVDAEALGIYRRNLETERPLQGSVSSFVDYQVRGQGDTAKFLYEPELIGEAQRFHGNVDAILAGPPCQGNSSLNNRTRGDDRRNRLYLTVPAFAIASGAPTVIIENVAGVARSRGNVVDSAVTLLTDAGYSVVTGFLSADQLGWPQTRKRFFLLASRQCDPTSPKDIRKILGAPPAPVSWAIGDLLDIANDDPMNRVAELSSENADRVAWLFENDAHDTPNHLRPDCHKQGTTYGAVYGRMWWDRPAPTLTTGFLTPGRGRFIHPRRPRTLTPREAARIQGFPDWFDFRPPGDPFGRGAITRWIGNAVPSILGYAAGMGAFGAIAGIEVPDSLSEPALF